MYQSSSSYTCHLCRDLLTYDRIFQYYYTSRRLRLDPVITACPLVLIADGSTSTPRICSRDLSYLLLSAHMGVRSTL